MLVRSVVSALGIGLVAVLAVGCAAEPSGETDAPLNIEPDDYRRGSGGAESELEIVAGPDIEFLDSDSASVEEWLSDEGVEGNELEALLDGDASGGDVAGNLQPKGFGGVMKPFKGVVFSIKPLPNMIKVGSFLSTPNLPNDVLKGMNLWALGPVKSLLQPLGAFVLALQAQIALRSDAPLEAVPAAQGARLSKKFGGKGTDYKVHVGVPFTKSDGTKVSNRIYLDTRKGKKPVLFRSVATAKGKSTVLDIPSGVL